MFQYHILFLLLQFYSFGLSAQLVDDFSDNDFTNNPTWSGDAANFTAAAGQLTGAGAVAGDGYLSLGANMRDSISWDFWVNLNLSPSTSNYMRIFLMSDAPVLSGPSNGYYLQIGENSTTDVIRLRKQTGSTFTTIFSGTGSMATNGVARVRVTRNAQGEWRLFADYTGGNNLQADGTGTDNTFTNGNYFGIYLRYSTNNATNFRFDDLRIDPLYQDTQAPSVVSVEPLSATTIKLTFAEALFAPSVQDLANYSLTGGINVATATLGANPTEVNLTLASPMTNLQQYTLEVTDVADLAQNVMSLSQHTFTFIETQPAQPLDLIINEIMADPSPVVGLPDAEYVEILNRAPYAINLDGLEFADLSGTVVFPETILMPNQYLVVTSQSSAPLFTARGIQNVLGLAGFPSLTNSGETLVLRDANGIGLHSVSFTDDWYIDPLKTDGGWSLELINPGQTCKGQLNWIASNDPTGGSPGRQNSVLNNVPDPTPPQLLSVRQKDSVTVEIVFDDILEPATALNFGAYQVSGCNVVSVVFANAARTAVWVTVDANFANNQTYLVTASGVRDCVGNILVTGSGSFTFLQVSLAVRYDLIINEIFADASPVVGLKSKEYVEIYNRSNKNISLEGFTLSDGSSSIANLPAYIIRPGEYVLIHSASDTVSYREWGTCLAMSPFPDLNTTGDELVLLDGLGRVVDAVAYEPSWYGNSSKAEGGWSLERTNPNRPCEAATNWAASVNLRGGTPCRQNSNWATDPDASLPDMIRAFPLSGDSVLVFFSEALGEASATNTNNYSFGAGRVVTSARLLPSFYNSVLLRVSPALSPDSVYTIQANNTLQDCMGNGISSFYRSTRVAIPVQAESLDLVINEILPNPNTYGSDFVEIYNRSNKVLNAADLLFANMDANGIDDTEVVEVDFLIFPGDYLVFSPEPTNVIDNYPMTKPYHMIKQTLPGYDDNEGTVLMFSNQGVVIDSFVYTNDLHTSLLDDENGVSLERVNPNAATNDISNWHSAAEAAGWATPTMQNSNYLATRQAPQDSLLTLSQQYVSPDGDSYQDFVLINYNVGQPGYVGKVVIYDAQGLAIRTLVRNELLQPSGFWQWDGTNDEGLKARLGIHLIAAEFFDANGNVRRQVREVVVAGK